MAVLRRMLSWGRGRARLKADFGRTLEAVPLAPIETKVPKCGIFRVSPMVVVSVVRGMHFIFGCVDP